MTAAEALVAARQAGLWIWLKNGQPYCPTRREGQKEGTYCSEPALTPEWRAILSPHREEIITILAGERDQRQAVLARLTADIERRIAAREHEAVGLSDKGVRDWLANILRHARGWEEAGGSDHMWRTFAEQLYYRLAGGNLSCWGPYWGPRERELRTPEMAALLGSADSVSSLEPEIDLDSLPPEDRRLAISAVFESVMAELARLPNWTPAMLSEPDAKSLGAAADEAALAYADGPLPFVEAVAAIQRWATAIIDSRKAAPIERAGGR